MKLNFYNNHRRKFAEVYPRISHKAANIPQKAFEIFNKGTTAIVYLVFVICFCCLIFQGSYIKAAKFVAVPFIAFAAVTAVRALINAPRPYELFSIKPLVNKSTKGKSCPSRHSACATVIGLACLYINIPCGIAMLVLAAIITASRPIMGVHFPLDVIAGAGLSLVIGIPLFWLI